MKLIITYAIDNCIKNLKNTLLNLALTILTFLTLTVAFFIYDKTVYNEKKMNTFLINGIDSTGIINITNFDNIDDIEAFCRQLDELKDINCYGGLSSHGITYNCLSDLIDIQKKHSKHLNYEPDMLHIVEIRNSFRMACNINLYNGSIKQDNNNIQYIYLGYGFKNVPVGTQYIESFSDNQKIIFEVAGILAKDQQWLSEDVFNTDASPAKLLSNLNYEVITFKEQTSLQSTLLYCTNGNKIDKSLENKIINIGEKNNLNIVLGRLRNVFYEYKMQNKVLYNYLKPIIIIFAVVCITVMTCLQIVSTYIKIHELGILYAFGIRKTYYLLLFFIQNGFIAFVSFILSGCMSYPLLNRIYHANIINDNININDIFCLYTLPKVLLVGIIIVTASSFITYMIMRRYTAREMISNNI